MGNELFLFTKFVVRKNCFAKLVLLHKLLQEWTWQLYDEIPYNIYMHA